MILAFGLFPVTLYYLSPFLSLGGMASGIVTGSILVFLGQLTVAAVAGRLFCGWACPAGGLQELVGLLRRRRVNRRAIGWIKWAIWGPWMVAMVFMALRAGGVHAVDFTYQTTNGISVADASGAIALISVVLVFFSLSMTIGRRAGCHVLCWMAPFMIIGTRVGEMLRIPRLRIASSPDRCRDCGACTAACPMSIAVEEEAATGAVLDPDCILCGSCADACPRRVLRFSFYRIERR